MEKTYNQSETHYPLPQPEEISRREKDDAMGAYLMMFASIGAGLPLPIINLIAIIIYYFINRGKSRFVRFHMLQSLWSQVPVTLCNAVGVFWAVGIFMSYYSFNNEFLSFIYTLIAINLIYFTFSIIGAVRAYHGRFYYFLFFGKLAYNLAYKIREDKVEQENKSNVNLPPS
jgi:uncharacterized Tic20 family protein